jgi:hypothetical protein
MRFSEHASSAAAMRDGSPRGASIRGLRARSSHIVPHNAGLDKLRAKRFGHHVYNGSVVSALRQAAQPPRAWDCESAAAEMR